ncbi:MAG: D-2-hydroxyacid dehydrogenase [Chlamydiia bacterium]|nr:D-2-hydroxyacid dehydrogenase [Chlamydiia bacterium]
MNTALLQYVLSFDEINQLIHEFPQYLFLSFAESSLQSITKEHWPHVEILFSNHITPYELELAKQLRWIHCPTSNLQRLCLKEIEAHENILITSTREENLPQMGELAMSAILAFAKNLFHWKEAKQAPIVLFNSKWRNNLWTLKGKTLLQVGLEKEGTEIAKKGSEWGLHVIGAERRPTFHPHCKETHSLADLPTLLPEADIVSLCLPRDKTLTNLFGKEEFQKMKNDSILLVIGSNHMIDDQALSEVGQTEKFRGIFIDATFQTPIPPQSPLWTLPNSIITPDIAPRPKKASKLPFHTFIYNMRQYIHGNFADMKNLYKTEMIRLTEEKEWT